MKSFAICACLASCALGFATQQTGKPAFEVASVKPSDPNPNNRIFVGMNADTGTVHYTNITLKDCIRAAWRVRDFQIQGPDWIGTARFEIIAKLPAGVSMDQIPEMMQTLLADRFGLTIQHAAKEQSVYALIVGKNGPNLKPALVSPDAPPATALGPDGRPRPAIQIGIPASGVTISAPAASLATLAETISRFTQRPVIDMTGLTGQYQFELYFDPETMGSFLPQGAAADAPKAALDPAPSMFDEVQKYGLKIETRKARLEFLTVTHAEKTPTEN